MAEESREGTGPERHQTDDLQSNPADEQTEDAATQELDEESGMLCTRNITPNMSSEERYFRLGQACEEFDAKVFMSIEGWLLDELKKWDKYNCPRLSKEVLRQAIEWTCGESPDDDD